MQITWLWSPQLRRWVSQLPPVVNGRDLLSVVEFSVGTYASELTEKFPRLADTTQCLNADHTLVRRPSETDSRWTNIDTDNYGMIRYA